MSTAGTGKVHESRQSLWMITLSPLIWGAHFLACYITAAVWCAKFGGPEEPLTFVRICMAIYTAIALPAIAAVGWIGWRRHRRGDSETPHAADTPEDRHRFLGFATVLLSSLSAVATIYVAMVAIFITTC